MDRTFGFVCRFFYFFPPRDLFPADVCGRARQPLLGGRHIRLGPAGVCQRSSARSSGSSGMSPPTLAPWAGSSSRVVARIPDQRVSHAFAAAARSQGGASAARAWAASRIVRLRPETGPPVLLGLMTVEPTDWKKMLSERKGFHLYVPYRRGAVVSHNHVRSTIQISDCKHIWPCHIFQRGKRGLMAANGGEIASHSLSQTGSDTSGVGRYIEYFDFEGISLTLNGCCLTCSSLS